MDTEHIQWLVGLITGLDMKDDNSLLFLLTCQVSNRVFFREDQE